MVLNYLRAELYKALHRNYFWIMLAVMLALEALFALFLWFGANDFAYLTGVMTSTMPVGSFLAILLADLVASDPFKTGTMKNELAFGLPRSRIYLGKLAAAVTVAMLFCVILFAWYLSICWLFSSHGDPGAVQTNLGILAYVAAASLPFWLATLSVSTAFFLTLKSQFAGVAVVFFLLTGGLGILGLVSMMRVGPVSAAAKFIIDIAPIVPEGYHGDLTWALMAKHWLLGLGWTVLSSAVGMVVFRRREVK